MIIITDNIEYSKQYFNPSGEINSHGAPLTSHIESAFLSGKSFSYSEDNKFWKYAFVTEYAEDSQFDILARLASQNIDIPSKSLYLAGHGKKFHGFRKRQWESLPGNIHLSCYFKPMLKASDIGLGFTMLSAVSVIDTLDSIPELSGKSGIKWVNDVIIESSKISGVIAQTQIQGELITDAIIGIGLNVESVPSINSTSFVPKASSVNSESNNVYSYGYLNGILIEKIAENYLLLQRDGLEPILEKYIKRSIIIGKSISVWSDPHSGEPQLVTSGRVNAIGEYLELYLDGQEEPITSGRIVPD